VLPEHGIRISAQSRLESFYAGFGFVVVGERYLEDGILHTEMVLGAG
jgi:ElaA protein